MLVLASNSPRRRQLIALGGWPFRVVAAGVDETPLPNEDPHQYVQRLALAKGRAILALASPAEVIVAADTTVADGGEILGKPSDEADAWRMLRQLGGRSHQVYTGVAVLGGQDNLELVELAATDVPMRHYTDSEIASYIASGDPFDKAGAYAIQHSGFHPVDRLTGCYANVMGLPLCHLARALRLAGVLPLSNIPLACQQTLAYHCDIFEQILPQTAPEQPG